MSSIGQVNSSNLASSIYNTSQTKKTSSDYGKTIGEPKLSETASKYYDELKSKFSDMEFVLVSNDKSDQAEQLAQKYANSDKALVLIDEEQLEKMATDEEHRAKYEGIIADSKAQLNQMAEDLEKNGVSDQVAGFGIKVNDDGTTSYFAVLKDSSNAQKQRIEQKAAEKKEAQKAAEKKAKKKETEEAVKEKGKADKSEKTDSYKTVTADSIDDLVKKINDSALMSRSDNVLTPQEQLVGQNFDLRF